MTRSTPTSNLLSLYAAWYPSDAMVQRFVGNDAAGTGPIPVAIFDFYYLFICLFIYLFVFFLFKLASFLFCAAP